MSLLKRGAAQVNTANGAFTSGTMSGLIETSISCSGWEELLREDSKIPLDLTNANKDVDVSPEEPEEQRVGQSLELQQSTTLLAQFLRSQYIVTGNFRRNVEEFEVLKVSCLMDSATST